MGECRGEMAKVLDSGFEVSEFDLLSHDNTKRKGMNTLISSGMGQIVPLLFFDKNWVGIKLSTKVDMPLNKEDKPKPK